MLENMRDRDISGRNGTTKLTDSQVREIRSQYASKRFTQATLAEMHNVGRVAIQRLAAHKAYKWV